MIINENRTNNIETPSITPAQTDLTNRLLRIAILVLATSCFGLAGAAIATKLNVSVSIVSGTAAIIGFIFSSIILRYSTKSNKQQHLEKTAISLPKEQQGLEKIEVSFEKTLDILLPLIEKKEEINAHDQLFIALDETKSQILDHWKMENDYKVLTESIVDASKRDLYFDDEHIQKQFQIDEKLESFPEKEKQTRRDALQKIINEAYVTKELKNKRKLAVGEPEEVSLLRAWDYLKDKNALYHDKEFTSEIIVQMIHDEFAKECSHPPSLSYIKNLIYSCTLRGRLQTVGITSELSIKKFQFTCNFLKNKQETIDASLSNAFERTAVSRFPLAQESIKQGYELAQKAKVVKQFRNRPLLDNFKNEKTGFESYQKGVETHITPKIEKVLKENVLSDALFKEQIDFYDRERWGDYLEAEFIQGLNDTQEVFENGVCFGTCERLRLSYPDHEEIDLEHLKNTITEGVISKDRFLQSSYATNLRLTKKSKEEEKALFDSSDSITKELFDEHADEWIRFRWIMEGSGHITLLRFTKQPQQILFFDPNVGLFIFKKKSLEDPLNLFRTFIDDLKQTFYPDAHTILGSSLVK